MRRSITLILACACLSATVSAGPVAKRSYARMSEAERTAYIEEKAREISGMLTGSPEASIAITPDALQLIKREVDDYASRLKSDAAQPQRENIRNVLARGAANAPVIKQAFAAEGLPAITGLYLAMIESEYNECLESPSGARGMFQFLPKTGSLYGVEPADLCDLTKAAPAAARYIRDRRGEFGTDPLGSVLVLVSYNQGQVQTRQVFQEALGKAAREEREQGFWAVLARPEEKDSERSRYVPRFFAAAIIGENPADFGIRAQSLSRY